ncbi:nuclear transport factor 2 family protein [Streptomyces sp. HSW2009]|uniref:nuclear transport factor 2 family protein n=1 Tax=Streptomyces sp. HSW2009 TaxID=3142890 RepID=UPI0032EC7D32
MSTESTRAIIETYLAKTRARDLDGAVALFAEDVDWDAPASGATPWSGRRSSRAEVAEFFHLLHQYLATDEFTVTHTVVEGDDGVIIGHLTDTVKATGAKLHTPFAAHVTVQGDHISRYRLFEDTHALAKALDGVPTPAADQQTAAPAAPTPAATSVPASASASGSGSTTDGAPTG